MNRLAAKRIAEGKSGRRKQCGHCGEIGHNRRGCPELRRTTANDTEVVDDEKESA